MADKDVTTPVIAIVGATALAVGAYLILKKPPGVPGGGKVKAAFKFTYTGPERPYVFQVSFGRIIWEVVTSRFDHVEGLIFETPVTVRAGQQTVDVTCELPAATTPNSYDAEALIKSPGMGQFQYIEKAVTKNAIKVVK